LIGCVFSKPPPLAFNVRMQSPDVALEEAVSVNVLLPVPGVAMLDGEKLAVTPAGKPVSDNATAD
jgi:hypothetical protein